MKKKPIWRWIMRCFTISLVLSIAASAAVNLYEAYNDNIELNVDWAEICANNITHLLDHQWSLEALKRSADSITHRVARITLHTICQDYEMDDVYVYSIDLQEPSRYYYIYVSADDEIDSDNQGEYDLKRKATDELTPGEQALLNGSSEIQQEFQSNVHGQVITLLAPYYDSDGKFRAVIGMNYNLSQIHKKTLEDFFTDILPFLIFLTLGLMILLILVQRRIVQPIRLISYSMNRFARDSRQKPESLHIRSGDEIGEIAVSFDKMTKDISAYVNNIERLTKEKLETDVQLDVARRIQYGIVPEKTIVNGDGFRVGAMTHPAKAVGGDFYDCFQRNDGAVCIVMGDVSGKGITAAIFMAMIRTVIREKLMSGMAPARALNQTNDGICAQNPEGLFATAFAAVLDIRTGELRYANAGHTHPVLVGKKPVLLKLEAGIALGMFENADLKDATINLAPSEGILLYTDGVTEAVNPHKQFFGEEGLMNALAGTENESDPESLLRHISHAVYDFCEGMEPFDDMAVLALLRTPGESGWKAVPVALSSFDEVKKAVLATAGDAPETRRALLACDEALSNIVNYSGAKSLAFLCKTQGDELIVRFSDDGIYFDPTRAQLEEKSFDALEEGGMGLSFIRQSVSSMSYERREARNELTLRFPRAVQR